MAKKISVQTRQELVRAIAQRYRAATKEEKTRILDEFSAVTGHHRKYPSAIPSRRSLES